jgi:tetratricopeptide (TPR) repeat protein
MAFSSPSEFNEAAIQLRAQGKLPEAAATLRAGIAQFPNIVVLRQNLAQTLYESGEIAGAIAEHRAALATEESVASHMALYELLQMTGAREDALAHQLAALRVQRLFSYYATNPQRTVLCLCAPGDWQTNVPVDFLFDRKTTTVHKLFLVDEQHTVTDAVPAYDVVWNTIAESPEAVQYLAFANHFMRAQHKPALNAPAYVIGTARPLLERTLSNTGARVAPVAIVDRETLRNAALPFAFPMIARPLGSHAGHGLERLESAESCKAYTAQHPADRYFVSPFIDYASADGYFRKYRLVFVDGVPYPVHLAISPNWMIHYYNAPMADHQWMRDEEAAFLEDPRGAFDATRFATLVGIGKAVGLEYFGIDCSIDRDGKVLVFEADAAMLVHTSDPVDLYPYKQRFVPRIYRAVEQMIDRRKTGVPAADT